MRPRLPKNADVSCSFNTCVPLGAFIMTLRPLGIIALPSGVMIISAPPPSFTTIGPPTCPPEPVPCSYCGTFHLATCGAPNFSSTQLAPPMIPFTGPPMALNTPLKIPLNALVIAPAPFLTALTIWFGKSANQPETVLIPVLNVFLIPFQRLLIVLLTRFFIVFAIPLIPFLNPSKMFLAPFAPLLKKFLTPFHMLLTVPLIAFLKLFAIPLILPPNLSNNAPALLPPLVKKFLTASHIPLIVPFTDVPSPLTPLKILPMNIRLNHSQTAWIPPKKIRLIASHKPVKSPVNTIENTSIIPVITSTIPSMNPTTDLTNDFTISIAIAKIGFNSVSRFIIALPIRSPFWSHQLLILSNILPKASANSLIIGIIIGSSSFTKKSNTILKIF